MREDGIIDRPMRETGRMNIPRTRVALRAAGFVLVGAVDALWIGPVYAAVEAAPAFQGLRGVTCMTAVMLASFVLGVCCWLASFAMCVADETPVPAEEGKRRARIAWSALRTLAQWMMTLTAAPAAFFAALTLLIAW